ncbi:hypothetical protein HDU98_002215 [Podochytrium sp. JEL0797]|nr:hypothetical protein HDU98_002215 [Podochytrium sp. JEL0797]
MTTPTTSPPTHKRHTHSPPPNLPSAKRFHTDCPPLHYPPYPAKRAHSSDSENEEDVDEVLDHLTLSDLPSPPRRKRLRKSPLSAPPQNALIRFEKPAHSEFTAFNQPPNGMDLDNDAVDSWIFHTDQNKAQFMPTKSVCGAQFTLPVESHETNQLVLFRSPCFVEEPEDRQAVFCGTIGEGGGCRIEEIFEDEDGQDGNSDAMQLD